MITVGAWMRQAVQTLENINVDAAQWQVYHLVCHLLHCDVVTLLQQKDMVLSEEHQSAFSQLLHRLKQHEPLAYVVGSIPFYGLEIEVCPAVLIPRPETEQLVEHLLAKDEVQQSKSIEDWGTGSGCIALALAHHLPKAQIVGRDCSREALKQAERNRSRLQSMRVHFAHWDWHIAQPPSYGIDCIVSNPPYIAEHAYTHLDRSVRVYEPITALVAGQDGLESYRTIAKHAYDALRSGGVLALEIGYDQAEALKALFTSPQWCTTTLIQDYAGHTRFLFTTKSG